MFPGIQQLFYLHDIENILYVHSKNKKVVKLNFNCIVMIKHIENRSTLNK